jgi:prophage regulatory protein
MNDDASKTATRVSSVTSCGRISDNCQESLAAYPTLSVSPRDRVARRPIRMLRLAQVIDVTGLGKTKIYELQAEGSFPMRVKITAHSVAWIEEEVQAWLIARVQERAALTTA